MRVCFIILISLCFICTGCGFRKASSVTFTNEDGIPVTLNALSKRAVDGVFPLGKNANYRYELERALLTGPLSSLELEYSIDGVNGINGAEEPVFVFEKEPGYALPVDVSFLDGASDTETLQYSMPLNTALLNKFSFNIKGGSAEGASLKLKSISVSKLRFGYEKKGSTFWISPFVAAGKSAAGAPLISVSPRSELDEKHQWELKLRGISGNVFIETRGKRYQYKAMEEKMDSFSVPGAFTGVKPVLVIEGRADSILLLPVLKPPLNEPINADPGFIKALSKELWRNKDYEFYRWESFPSILIFDISNYEVQDKMLKRLAFFIEKKGYRGRLVNDDELEDKHGWNAHDYNAESLASFFNAVKKQNFPINEEERMLEQIVLNNKIIAINEQTGTYEPLSGAIISVSRQSNDYLYTRFLVHECFHGLFFIDNEFREFSRERYANFNAKAKAFIRSYFDYLGYDINDSNLMINEFMAYLLQQSPGAAGEYFGKYAAGIIEKSDWRKSVLPAKNEESGTWPLLTELFEAESMAFSNYVSRRWGLSAGCVWRISAE
ncbi:MAG: hypothetical protein LBG79_00920 [Spirochaetaceae bacterium]|jgi:hypothetical protein|nr:hypothetical protein [Spirochaetaceae bacterium]GMO17051.1 MAG: hypothetical protein Pg6A_03280 [Termitinemataceae bacterium]